MSNISPLAFVSPDAIIGENCEIGPFCYIDKDVVIGNDNVFMNSVTILSGARIGHQRHPAGPQIQGRNHNG